MLLPGFWVSRYSRGHTINCFAERILLFMFSVNAWSGLWTPPGLHALAPALPFLILWEGFWKGLALWHSGRRGQSVWFVILIVVNTIGILPIIYLFAVAHLKVSELFSKKT
jgi:hypothetical protein